MSKWIPGKSGYNKEYLNGFIRASIKYYGEEVIVKIIGNRTVKMNYKSVNEAIEFTDHYIKHLIEFYGVK